MSLSALLVLLAVGQGSSTPSAAGKGRTVEATMTPLLSVVAIRRVPSDPAEAELDVEEREKRLVKAGFVALGVPDIHAYVDPSLLTTPTMKALSTLLARLSWPAEMTAVKPGQLGPEGQKALALVLAQSPFRPEFQKHPLDGPRRVATASTASVTMDFGGRKVKLDVHPNGWLLEDAPVALPKGLPLPQVSEALTVEWMGVATSEQRDSTTVAIFAAFARKREESLRAFREVLSKVARASIMEGESKPDPRSLTDLPAGLQASLRTAIKNGFLFYGFKTPEEAMAACDAASISGLSFRANLVVSDLQNKSISIFGLQTVRL